MKADKKSFIFCRKNSTEYFTFAVDREQFLVYSLLANLHRPLPISSNFKQNFETHAYKNEKLAENAQLPAHER